MPDFRAFTGAVSLKLVQDGHIRAMDANFRAFTGAVSLKRDLFLVILGRRVDFRAFTGAVSLKHVRCLLRFAPSVQFPRLHRRGLIEAVRLVEWPRVLRRISAPSQARSH